MRQRVKDIVRVGDSLFSKRYPLLSLWQSQAENFHVMRADFTRQRYASEEFGSYLMTGRPARCHRDLKNAFSAMLRPITMQLDGIKYGAEQMDRLEAGLDDAFYLSKIRFPQISKEMTAYEASKVWEDFMRESLPLFEPVEVEYNANICDGSFEDLMALGTFGSIEDIPQILRGRDISWQFDTPITVAAERALTGAFQSMVQTLTEGAQVDPSVVLNADMDQATRDAIDGGGAPAKWLRPVDQVKKLKQEEVERAQAAQAAEQVAHGADVATRVAGAAESAGNAARSLQEAGVA